MHDFTQYVKSAKGRRLYLIFSFIIDHVRISSLMERYLSQSANLPMNDKRTVRNINSKYHRISDKILFKYLEIFNYEV